jgi:hypothetical protein
MTLYELAAHVLKKERGTFRVYNTLTGERLMFVDPTDALLYMENVDAVYDLSPEAFKILEVHSWSLAPA